MNIRQRIEYIFDEIDKISHPPTKIMSISEVEEELSKYEEGELITISYPGNTTEAWESENLSDYSGYENTGLDVIKAGQSKYLTQAIEDLRISRKTQVTFIPCESNDNRMERIRTLYRELNIISPTYMGFSDIIPTQTNIAIRIENPIIPILGAFKKMCRRREQRMLATIKREKHPRSEQEAIEDAITGICRNWDKPGGYRGEIAKIKKVNHDDIQCDLMGKARKKLRNPAEHKRHNLTVSDITDLVRKAQELTPEDIIITDTKKLS